MVDGERLDPVVVAIQRVAGPHLHELEREREPPEDAAQALQQLAQARRPVDRERELAAPQGERLQHAGQTEVVVGVVVREQHLAQLDEADSGAQELPLGAFAAIEEESLAAPPQHQARRSPTRCRHRPRGAEKGDLEIHRDDCRGR